MCSYSFIQADSWIVNSVLSHQTSLDFTTSVFGLVPSLESSLKGHDTVKSPSNSRFCRFLEMLSVLRQWWHVCVSCSPNHHHWRHFLTEYCSLHQASRRAKTYGSNSENEISQWKLIKSPDVPQNKHKFYIYTQSLYWKVSRSPWQHWVVDLIIHSISEKEYVCHK